MWETAALVEQWERKGVLTRIEVLAMIQEWRRKHPRGQRATGESLVTVDSARG